MDTAGQAGSGTLRIHKDRNAKAWTSNQFLSNTGRLPPRQKKAVA